jgi:hypothetical protein
MNDDCTATTLAPPGKPVDNRLDAVIERWWADHFQGSAVARDTAAWNAAHAAKEALKRLLAPAPSPPPAVADKELKGSI